MSGGEQHDFTAMKVNARTGGTFVERFVRLDIRKYDERAGKFFQSTWSRMQDALKSFHDNATEDSGPLPGWVGWKVRDWMPKNNPPERLKFIAWDGDAVAGFINLRADFPSEITAGKKIIYIEHMATAPGNIRTRIWCRQLISVGLALLAFAAKHSFTTGGDGAFGLHAADDDATDYYRKVNDAKLQGRLFGIEKTGVAAPPPVGDSGKSKPYFEASASGAADLLRLFRRG